MTQDHAPSALLRSYEALDGTSEEMLRAARSGDWDSVCRLEGACIVLIARLQQLALHGSLQPPEQALRLRILRAIVARDAEIRRLADSQLPMLEPLGWLASPPARPRTGCSARQLRPRRG